MAGNKTSPNQTERAAKINKSRSGAGKALTNSAAINRTPPPFRLFYRSWLPSYWACGMFCAGVAVILLGMLWSPDGKLVQLLRDLLMNLFGRGTFILAIFGMAIMAFLCFRRTTRHLGRRAFFMGVFLLSFGMLQHLLVNDASLETDTAEVLLSFYQNGITGASGGFICGTLAALLRLLLGKGLSIVLMLVTWVMSLLRVMDATLLGLVGALNGWSDPDDDDQDLPAGRSGDADDGKNEKAGKRTGGKYARGTRVVFEPEEEEGPTGSERMASFVQGVHTKFRTFWDSRKAAMKNNEYYDDDDYEAEEPEPAARVAAKPEKDTKPKAAPRKPVDPRIQDMINQLDADIEQPVSVAGSRKAISAPAEEAEPDDMPDLIPAAAVRKVTAREAAVSAAEVTAEIARAQTEQKPVYKFPPIDLLKAPGKGAADGTSEMKKNSARLNETLESFKIDAHIINVTRGPSVTRYEVELDKGVRLNKLTTVADDIALSLGVTSVRIAPVPGKISVVGIEVPNGIVTNVALREVIDSREFHKSASKSSFAVGKDIGGTCIVGNIAKMPHMLIAGTTGSGKSVCMNSIIISLLYKASPEDVKLIMVDPKMVELGIYNDIPHLLIPVVTDPKKAAGSLQWAVTEMMRRYKLMSDAGVRDLESFNSIVESEDEGEKLPQVVIIIDELADLMLVAAKEVEDSICRIAQMGRAAGMHLIIATQRPSADVITGLMKANIPSRIAFSVASAMESRIILDTQGAEKLVGKGDMLYAPIGIGKPQRVQGCFVSDGEVEAVATFVKENYKANYDTGVMDEIEKTAIQTGKKGAAAPDPEANAEELDGDEMLPAAVDVILETGQASVSMLQRRLKLGYARAARIVDEMEEKGIVGPFQGSKPRSILITKEQWEAKKNGNDQTSVEDIPFDLDAPDFM